MPTPICAMAAAATKANPIHENNFILVSAFPHGRRLACCYAAMRLVKCAEVVTLTMMKDEEI
jgi:hypothetical protein